MKRRHHTPGQVVRKVTEGQKLLPKGKSVDEVAKYLKRIAKYTAWVAGCVTMWHDYFPAAGWGAAPGPT